MAIALARKTVDRMCGARLCLLLMAQRKVDKLGAQIERIRGGTQMSTYFRVFGADVLEVVEL